MVSMRRWAAAAAAALLLLSCRKSDLSEGSEPSTTAAPFESPPPTGKNAAPATMPGASSAAGPAGSTLAVPTVPASFAPIARRADPGVVTINTVEEQEPPAFFPGAHNRLRRQVSGLGTGFIFDKDGLILTNNHVIKGADKIVVKLWNEKSYPGRVIGKDARTDLAVVKIEEHGLTPLVLGDSDAIEVGDWVVAIGNPYALSHTVSAGILSAKGRTRDDVPLDPSGYYNFLQTDASINPGNSGGPLLNMRGEVVGINTAIKGSGRDGPAQGLAFAIPINMVKQLLPMLVRDGHVTRSAIGVKIVDIHDIDPDDRAALKLTSDRGALVEYVEPGGGADKAHIATGDVILAFDGTSIDKATLLTWLASTAGVGRTVVLHILREGKEADVKVKLGQLPERPDDENEARDYRERR